MKNFNVVLAIIVLISVLLIPLNVSSENVTETLVYQETLTQSDSSMYTTTYQLDNADCFGDFHQCLPIWGERGLRIKEIVDAKKAEVGFPTIARIDIIVTSHISNTNAYNHFFQIKGNRGDGELVAESSVGLLDNTVRATIEESFFRDSEYLYIIEWWLNTSPPIIQHRYFTIAYTIKLYTGVIPPTPTGTWTSVPAITPIATTTPFLPTPIYTPFPTPIVLTQCSFLPIVGKQGKP